MKEKKVKGKKKKLKEKKKQEAVYIKMDDMLSYFINQLASGMSGHGQCMHVSRCIIYLYFKEKHIWKTSQFFRNRTILLATSLGFTCRMSLL